MLWVKLIPLYFFHSQIIFSSLNIQGLKDLVKKKCTLLFCKGQKCHSLFLQDTHSVDADVTFWINRWGDQILFSHGSNPSEGVAICFNKFPGQIITYKADREGLFLIATRLYGHK